MLLAIRMKQPASCKYLCVSHSWNLFLYVDPLKDFICEHFSVVWKENFIIYQNFFFVRKSLAIPCRSFARTHGSLADNFLG